MEQTQSSTGTHLTLLAPPQEVLTLIVSQLCLHCHERERGRIIPYTYLERECDFNKPELSTWYYLNRLALYNLCLVSRQCRSIAEPILYHEFPPFWAFYPSPSAYPDWADRLAMFLRTVGLDSAKAAYVRRVCIHSNRMRCGGDLELAALAVREVFQARGIQLGPVYDAIAKRELELSDFGVRPGSRPPDGPKLEMGVLLLLAVLPNLTSLVLPNGFPSIGIPSQAIRLLGREQLVLQSYEVRASRPGGFLRYPLNVLEMASETLTSLTLDYPLDLSLRLIEPVPLPNLRHLYLLNSSIGHQNLKGVDHWLFKLKGLETFDYESDAGVFNPKFPWCILTIILNNKSTLKRLRLDTTTTFYKAASRYQLPDFSLFRSLRHLTLSSLWLYEKCSQEQWNNHDDSRPHKCTFRSLHRHIPSSLISLRVNDNMGPQCEMISLQADANLVHLSEEAIKGAFPNLKRVMYCSSRQANPVIGINFVKADIDYSFRNLSVGLMHEVRLR